jgi:O-antigen/teichoic acid export membrane protein
LVKRKPTALVDGGRGLWRSTLAMSVAGLLTTVLGIVRALLLPKLLGTPADYGLLLIVSLITGFGAYAHLGSTQGIYRQIPYLRGRGADEKQIDRLRNSTYGFTGLMSLLAVVGVLFIAGPSTFTSGLVYAVVISGGAFLVLLTNLTALITNLYQADQRFDELARFEVAFSFTSVTATLISAALWGVVGVIISQVTVQLLFLVLYRVRLGLPLKPRLRGEDVLRVLKVGLPLTLVGFLRYGLENVDAVIVARFIGGDANGFVKLAVTVGLFIILVPFKLGVVLNPAIAEQTGSGRLDRLRDNLLRYSELNAYLAGLVACVAALGVTALLPVYLPRYVPALPLIYIFILRSALCSSTTVAGNTLINLLLERKTYGRWLGVQLALLAASLALAIWLFFQYGSPLAVVLGATAVLSLYVLLLLFFTVREFALGTRGALKLLLRVCLPLAYLGLVTWGALWLMGRLTIGFWLWRFLLALGMAAAAALPLVIYEERRLGVLGMLFRRLFGGGRDHESA